MFWPTIATAKAYLNVKENYLNVVIIFENLARKKELRRCSIFIIFIKKKRIY